MPEEANDIGWNELTLGACDRTLKSLTKSMQCAALLPFLKVEKLLDYTLPPRVYASRDREKCQKDGQDTLRQSPCSYRRPRGHPEEVGRLLQVYPNPDGHMTQHAHHHSVGTLAPLLFFVIS